MGEIFITLDEENLAKEHIGCIIRKGANEGIDNKKEWLKGNIPRGHIFYKLSVPEPVFIEYAPLEEAWVPAVGENYLYIYCLWVSPKYKHKGYGTLLMNSCIEYAKAHGKAGICMLGGKTQKAWLSDRSFAEGFGFVPVDVSGEYELLALSLIAESALPKFAPGAKEMRISEECLCIYYSDQCPFTAGFTSRLKKYLIEQGEELKLIKVDSLEKAKSLPCVFNNFALFYKGEFVTVNLVDEKFVYRLMKG